MKSLILIFGFICSLTSMFADGLIVSASVEKTGRIKEGTYAGRAACLVLVSIENRSTEPITISFMSVAFHTSFRVTPEEDFLIPDWSSIAYSNYPGTRTLPKGGVEQFELPVIVASPSAVAVGKRFRLGFARQDERHLKEKPFETDPKAPVIWSELITVSSGGGAPIDFWGRKKQSSHPPAKITPGPRPSVSG